MHSVESNTLVLSWLIGQPPSAPTHIPSITYEYLLPSNVHCLVVCLASLVGAHFMCLYPTMLIVATKTLRVPTAGVWVRMDSKWKYTVEYIVCVYVCNLDVAVVQYMWYEDYMFIACRV